MNSKDSDGQQEHIRKRVGGSLTNLDPLHRLESLRQNVQALRGGKWRAPEDDGTLVRKTVGKTR